MTINRFFFIIIIVFLSLKINAQKNRIGFFYGLAGNELIRSTSLDGGASYDGKGSDIFGINYQRILNKDLYLETGLEYSKNKIGITPPFYPGIDLTPRQEDIVLITIPVYVKFTFFKYFFVNGGTLIDFEIDRTEYQSTDDQSGIGFGGGIGGQYTFRNFTFYINPLFRYHAVIPFQKENYQQHLTEAGIKFGLDYNF